MPIYSIKWGIMGVKSTPFWLRDVCWLEYGDLRTDENGQEFGFGVVCEFLIEDTLAASLQFWTKIICFLLSNRHRQ